MSQFPEDSGPLSHPIRPDSYMEISNFYTATVYNKGAELIRMFHTVAGAEKFRAGTDSYLNGTTARRDMRRFREGAGGCERCRPVAVQGLVQPGRHASGRGAARL
jgi:aminopeptidase N